MEKDFFNTQGAADYLGISIKTIYHYIHKKVIPYYKVQNRKVYFKKNDLDDFLFTPANRSSSIIEIKVAASEYEETCRINKRKETDKAFLQ